eukprot:m.114108 g.114108  ORF g.114108 m.114108 type:complete len:253 (-) comp28331_c1_seq4:305-1063(-)
MAFSVFRRVLFKPLLTHSTHGSTVRFMSAESGWGKGTSQRIKVQKNATHYDVLGIPPGASASEIKKAYHDLARMYHPDANRGLSTEDSKLSEERFIKVSDAFTVLGTEADRRQYDRAQVLSREGPEGLARMHRNGYTYHKGGSGGGRDDFQFYRAASGGGQTRRGTSQGSTFISNTNIVVLAVVWMLGGVVVHLWRFSQAHIEEMERAQKRSEAAASVLHIARENGRKSGHRMQLENLKQAAARRSDICPTK